MSEDKKSFEMIEGGKSGTLASLDERRRQMRGGNDGDDGDGGMGLKDYVDARIGEVLSKVEATETKVLSELRVVDAHIANIPSKGWHATWNVGLIVAGLALMGIVLAAFALATSSYGSGHDNAAAFAAGIVDVNKAIDERLDRMEQINDRQPPAKPN